MCVGGGMVTMNVNTRMTTICGCAFDAGTRSCYSAVFVEGMLPTNASWCMCGGSFTVQRGVS